MSGMGIARGAGGKACDNRGEASTIQVAGLFSMELLLCLQVDLWPLELDHQVCSLCRHPHPPHGPPSLGGMGSSTTGLPCPPLAVVGVSLTPHRPGWPGPPPA